MCQQVYFVTVLCVVLAAFIQGAYALQCWKCSSETDSHCQDHFNTTEITQSRQFSNNYGNNNFPKLWPCDDMQVSQYSNQKNVCMKRVMTGPSGIKSISRECRLVNRDLKPGYCPDDVTNGANSKNLYFCGTCETDGCNGGNVLKTSVILTGIVPAVFLLLRK